MSYELIQVAKKSINQETVQTVSARDLHAFLNIGKDFSTWVKEQITRARLVENRDFIISPEKGAYRKPLMEYHLTLEAGKHVAMMSNTDKGFEVRDYFIECEKVAMQAMIPQNYAEALRQLADTVDAKEKMKAVLIEQQPKVDSYDQLMDTTGNYSMQSAAKVLGIGSNHLYQILRGKKVLLGEAVGRNHRNWNMPAQVYVDQGYFLVRTYVIHALNQNKNQTLVTPKGLVWLGKRLKDWNETPYLAIAS